MAKHRLLTWLAFSASMMALVVIALGALTRLIDAGLGCPDWPGCYGHFVVPLTEQAKQLAATQYPNTPLLSYKAWAEMIHRYAVSGLSAFILCIVISIFWHQKIRSIYNVSLAILLLMLLCYQILLGQLTVTLKLFPLIVTQHLLGGFFILAILWLLFLASRADLFYHPNKGMLPWAMLAFLLVLLQVFLGAWTSTHYASLSCPDFPFCSPDQPWPTLLWKSIFQADFNPTVTYEGGILSLANKQMIQMTHRLGALVVTCYLLIFIPIARIKLAPFPALVNLLMLILGLLCIQICFGIVNVLFKLPLASAISHNVMAILLLLSILTLLFKLVLTEKRVLST